MPHTLLLADDSVTIQRVIELTFADQDVRVVAVGDGRQAVRLVQSERPDIVLADVGMPELDGYEVAAFIKRTPGLQHIPVLLLTGAFEPIDEGRARSVGCDGVLVKPFEPQMVITRVKELIANARSVPSSPLNPPAAPGGVDDRPSAGAADSSSGQPAATAGGAAAEAARRAASESIEEYFDRVDAAFAAPSPASADLEDSSSALDAAFRPEAAAQRVPGAAELATELARWNSTDPAASPPHQQAGSGAGSPVAQTAPPAGSSGTASAQPRPTPPVANAAISSASLAEAFEALLAAEQGHPLESAAAQRFATQDAFVDHVTRLVIERLGDQRMREVVIEVAERLVREEIERIKALAR